MLVCEALLLVMHCFPLSCVRLLFGGFFQHALSHEKRRVWVCKTCWLQQQAGNGTDAPPAHASMLCCHTASRHTQGTAQLVAPSLACRPPVPLLTGMWHAHRRPSAHTGMPSPAGSQPHQATAPRSLVQVGHHLWCRNASVNKKKAAMVDAAAA